jgi:hypothetical protein
MTTNDKVVLENELLKTPKLTINDVHGINFERPQIYGGFQNHVNKKREYVGAYLKIKGVKVNVILDEIEVSAYTLKKYVDAKPLKVDDANKIQAWLLDNYSNMRQEVLIARKEAKIEAVKPTKREFNGENKEEVRDLFIEKLSKSKLKSGKFFTLPSDTCAFEIQANIAIDNNFHYVVCENKKSTFVDLLQTIAKRNLMMSANFGDSNEVLEVAKPNAFSHAFLDYCGTFPTYENEVRHLLVNKTVKLNGFIGLTFCCRERNSKEQTTIEFHQAIINEFDCDVTASVKGGIKFKLLSMLGNDYKLVEYVSYKDDSPMIFALLKRIK